MRKERKASQEPLRRPQWLHGQTTHKVVVSFPLLFYGQQNDRDISQEIRMLERLLERGEIFSERK